VKKINNNPFNLQVALGEEISVDVQSKNTTAHLVNAILDGQGHIIQNGDQLKFLVTRPKHKLTMVYTFATQSGTGGRYDTTVTGSNGGDTSSDTVSQDFGIPVDSTFYNFRVL
jgi:hypothetical protein